MIIKRLSTNDLLIFNKIKFIIRNQNILINFKVFVYFEKFNVKRNYPYKTQKSKENKQKSFCLEISIKIKMVREIPFM